MKEPSVHGGSAGRSGHPQCSTRRPGRHASRVGRRRLLRHPLRVDRRSRRPPRRSDPRRGRRAPAGVERLALLVLRLGEEGIAGALVRPPLRPDRELRTSDPIERPQVVAVFHEALIGSQDVAGGLGATGTIVVNSTRSPEELREALGLDAGTVAAVDALGIAVEEATRVNTAMLGAVARVCPFLDRDAIRATIAEKLGKRYAHLVEANLRTFDRGHAEGCVAGASAARRAAARRPAGARVRLPRSADRRRHPRACEQRRPHARGLAGGVPARLGRGDLRPLRPLRHGVPRPLPGLGGARKAAPYGCAGSITATARAACKCVEVLSDRRPDRAARRGRLGRRAPRAALPGAGGAMTAVLPAQRTQAFRSGNEMAAPRRAAHRLPRDGLLPDHALDRDRRELSTRCRPRASTEIVMIAGDGEHGAAGICYGAALGGGRVLQRDELAGPALLARAAAGAGRDARADGARRRGARGRGPLDIRGDHSDIYFALNTGWLVLRARATRRPSTT